jgi:hypothetical protein
MSFDFLDFGVETAVVGGVFDDAGGTVGFQKTVSSFDVAVPVAVFGLALDVVGVWVVYAVLEVVRGRGLVRVFCGVSVVYWVSWGGVFSECGGHAGCENDHLKFALIL